MCDGEIHLGRHGFRIFLGIDAARDDDLGAQFREGFLFRVIADQLLAAIRSPMTPIEENDVVFRGKRIPEVERAATHEIECQIRECVSGVKLFGHERSP
jgi:hypothetical protein